MTGRGPAFYGCVVDATALEILAVCRLRVVVGMVLSVFAGIATGERWFPWGDYALIAAMSGLVPMMFTGADPNSQLHIGALWRGSVPPRNQARAVLAGRR